jgi:hypothetical protein
VFALVALMGCTSDPAPPSPAPSITIETPPCGADAASCINAGAVTRDVSGVHVIHKRVTGDPVVAVRLLIDGGDRGGMQLWSEDMALEMLDLGGSSGLTLSSWRAAKTSIGASVSASMGFEYGSVSAVVPVVFWNELWSLLARAVESPVNDDYLISYLRDYNGHFYDAELDDADNAASITAMSSLLEGTIGNRYRESRDAMEQVVVSGVNEAWAGMVTKERLWVVVVGDVAWSDLRDKVTQAFGQVPSGHASKFAAPPAPRPPSAVSRAVVLDYPDALHWQISGCFLGPAPADPDYAPLAVAMKVLDRRLYAEVRDARGLAYSVGAYLSFGRQPIGWISLATSVPSEALPVVERSISDLARTPATSDELASARAILRSSIVSNNRTPSEIAGTLGAYQLTVGDRLGVESHLAALSDVTAETARRAFERYFRAVSLVAAGTGESLDEASLLSILPQAGPDGGAPDSSGGAAHDASDAAPRD